jgi:glycosyltransferase involved in cell wall biosynthesis
MRLGVDARELSGKPTGVGRYLGGLLREWTSASAGHGHEIVLYAHRPLPATVGSSLVRILPGGGGTGWEQRDLRRALGRDGIDVLFSPAYSTPLVTKVSRVVALHDISFAAHPEWFAWREGLRRRFLARRSAAVANTVVTISEFSKSEIVSRFGTAPAKVKVIPPGIDAPISTSSAQRADGAHVLFVGSIFNRRHVPELIEAFSSVARRHADATLHLVGDNRSYPHQDVAACIASSTARDRIHWHEYVPETTLQQLYAQASAFVFLSEYEGLGLTPLEALSAGIPPLLLDTAVARESCGEAAMYVTLDRSGALASSLERLLYDPSCRSALLANAPSTLARYQWTAAASDTLRVLEDAV